MRYANLYNIILFLLLSYSTSAAQTSEEITRTVRAYDHLLTEHRYDHNTDSLRAINYSLLAYLDRNLPGVWKELWLGFDSMGANIHTTLSPDNHIRVWSWDTGLTDSLSDGTHTHLALVEFQTRLGVQTRELPLIDFDDDSERYCRGICYAIDSVHLHDIDNKRSILYFFYFHSEGDSGYCNEDLQAFQLKNYELFTDNEAFSYILEQGDYANNVHLSYRCSSAAKYPPFWLSPAKSFFTVAVLDSNDAITSTAARYSLDRDIFFRYGYVYHPEPGKTFSDLKKTIMHSIDEIQRLKDSSDSDELENANSWLEDYLTATLPRLPETLTDSISPPSYSVRAWYTHNIHYNPIMTIVSSSDNTMRIWTWNTLTGGSMPSMNHIIEYKTANGIKTDRVYDAGNVDTIYTLSSKSGKKYYLVRSTWRGDGRHVGNGICAYSIDGEALTTNSIFEVPKDNEEYDSRVENGLQFVISIGEQDCPIAGITFDGKSNKLFIQQIEFDDKENRGFLSSEWNVYKFNGEHFIYKGKIKK
jgi:hypothetical protein